MWKVVLDIVQCIFLVLILMEILQVNTLRVVILDLIVMVVIIVILVKIALKFKVYVVLRACFNVFMKHRDGK